MSSPSPQSFKVAGSVPAYRIVRVDAAHNVALANTLTAAIAGVTVDNWDRAEAGAIAVQTHYGSRVKLLFNDTVAVGGIVQSDASGRGIPFAGVTSAATWVVGQLIGAAVSATGTIAEVLLQPHTRYGQD